MPESYIMPAKPTEESICEEATRLVDGPRRGEYGPAKDSFNNIAAVWSAILHKKLKEPLTAHEVAILMAGFKLVRESNKEKRDNRVDAVGYLILAQKIIDEA